MSTINNFDKSSTGIDIEFTGGYDTDRSHWDFEENFEIIKHSGFRESSLLYYTENGNVKNSEDITFSVKGKKEDLIKFLLDYSGESTVSEYRSQSKTDILEEVEEFLYDEMNIIEYEDKNQEIDCYNLEIVPSKELIKVVSRGYSQGDYTEVIYCPKDLKEVWGKGSSEVEMGKMFDNLLWDTAISATLTVNEEEFNYEENFDWYNWQREEFIKYVAEKTVATEEQLEQIVPTDLKCN